MSSEHGEMPAAPVGTLSRGNRPRSSEHGEMPAALDPLCAEVRHGATREMPAAHLLLRPDGDSIVRVRSGRQRPLHSLSLSAVV